MPVSAPRTAAKSLKGSKAFWAIYRRGRWLHGASLSIGSLPNPSGTRRIGLRTKRGLKGAVVRNRLKRQLRSILYAQAFQLRQGTDLAVVIHPRSIPAGTEQLREELVSLCKRANLLC